MILIIQIINPENDELTRLIRKGKRLFTKSLVSNKNEFWNPVHSKLSALLLLDNSFRLGFYHEILYLGGGHGTTVRHLSDLYPDTKISVIEFGITIDKIFTLIEGRKRIIPIMEDARHPERYSHLISQTGVEMLYQDIAQRDQVDMFMKNLRFLSRGGLFIFMLKTKSIRQDGSPRQLALDIQSYLESTGMSNEIHIVDLAPFQRSHYAFWGVINHSYI